MTTQRVQLAILVVLMVPMVVGGTQSQPISTATSPSTGSASLGTTTVITPANPVAELQMYLPQLNLTADQQTKIKAITTAQQTAVTATEKALADATTALRLATVAGNLTGNSETDILAATTRVGRGLGNVVVLRVKIAAQMRAVLTPAQLTQMAQLKAAQLAQERAAILNQTQQQIQAIESNIK